MRPHSTFTRALAAAFTAAALAAPTASAQAGPPTWPENPQPIESPRAALPGPPTWPTSPQPITRPPAVVDAQSEDWTPTETQIRSALAQERYYMSFGRH